VVCFCFFLNFGIVLNVWYVFVFLDFGIVLTTLSEQFQNLEKQKHTTLSEQSQNLEKQKLTIVRTNLEKQKYTTLSEQFQNPGEKS
jgi:hypothetical protein